MLQRSTRGRFAASTRGRFGSGRCLLGATTRRRRPVRSPSRAFGTRADASSSQHTASRALSRHGDAGPWFERRLVAASAPANGLLFTERLLSDRQPGSQKLASRPARTPRLASRTARVRGGPKVLKTQREPHRPAQRTAAALGSTDATLGSTDARQHPSTAPRPRMLLNEPLAMDDMAMDDGMSMGDDGSPAFCSGMAMTMYMEGFASALFRKTGRNGCLNMFFDSWTLDGKGRFVGALLGVFALAAAAEGVAAARRARGLEELVVTAEDSASDDDEGSDSSVEEGVYCDNEECGRLLAGETVVLTDGARDFCEACAPSDVSGFRRETARDRFANAVLEVISS
mmetsp:Transcript_32522/g.97897  ORF Transcript_32522/g.97897 Transcript_32522/m.97897 type:complete len:343 (+) Transcript_32522:1263-2291(+)